MTRLNVITFQPKHLQQMTLLPDERDVILSDVDFLDALTLETARYGIHAGFCGTAYWGDEILCVGGWFAISRDTCQLFIIPDALMLKKHPAIFARTTIKWRKKIEDFNRYSRLFAVALPGMSDWMKVIGFEFERVAENYNNTGKTYEMWGRKI